MKRWIRIIAMFSFAFIVISTATQKANATEMNTPAQTPSENHVLTIKSEPQQGGCKITWDAVTDAEVYAIVTEDMDDRDQDNVRNANKLPVNKIDNEIIDLNMNFTAVVEDTYAELVMNCHRSATVKVYALKKTAVEGAYTSVAKRVEKTIYSIPVVSLENGDFEKTAKEWKKSSKLNLEVDFPNAIYSNDKNSRLTSYEIRMRNAKGNVVWSKVYSSKNTRPKVKIKKGAGYLLEVRGTFLIEGKSYQGEWSDSFVVAIPKKITYTKKKVKKGYKVRVKWTAIKDCNKYKIKKHGYGKNKSQSRKKCSLTATYTKKQINRGAYDVITPYVQIQKDGKLVMVLANTDIMVEVE